MGMGECSGWIGLFVQGWLRETQWSRGVGGCERQRGELINEKERELGAPSREVHGRGQAAEICVSWKKIQLRFELGGVQE